MSEVEEMSYFDEETLTPKRDRKAGGPKYDMAPGRSDNFITPDYALDPLCQFIKSNQTVWECAAGVSEFMTNNLLNRGFEVYSTSIEQGYDFLDYELPCEYDLIVTNPPYKTKDKFLKRCYDLKKPFALLMPVTCLGEQYRVSLFAEYGIQLIMPPGRINFTTPVKKLAEGTGSSAWFYSIWFTQGLNLPRDINYCRFWNKPLPTRKRKVKNV